MLTGRLFTWVAGIAWTADSRNIVFSAGDVAMESLWRLPVSGGSSAERLPYVLPAALAPAIAGSPPRLIYTWYISNWNLWRLDTRTGERKALVTSTYEQRDPQYSPDGRKIAFQSNRSGSLEAWTCDSDGANCVQITSSEKAEGGGYGHPRWSPDSRWLALACEGGLCVVAADGGKPRGIATGAGGSSWSHDGHWIYFSATRSGRYEVWKIASDGSECIQVTHAGGFSALESPDGKYLYHIKSPQPGLFRMPTQGGEDTQILEGPVRTFVVTAKGVYFQPNPRMIQFLDIATGHISTAVALDRNLDRVTVSPDGAYVVWAQQDRNSKDLMLVDGFR